MRSANRLGPTWLVTAALALGACGDERDATPAPGDRTDDASSHDPNDASPASVAPEDAGLALASDGGVPDFTSSFDTDTIVSDLGDEQVRALCAELDAWANDLYAAIDDDVCEFAGLFFAAYLPENPIDTCEEQAATCLASPTESMTTCDIAETGSCTATVGEIEACLDAAREAFLAAFGGLDCSLAADPGALPPGGPAPPVTPDACTLLDGKCPGVSITPPMPRL